MSEHSTNYILRDIDYFDIMYVSELVPYHILPQLVWISKQNFTFNSFDALRAD